MAPLDPPVRNPDAYTPDYLRGIGGPITTPEADKSAGIALSTVGEGIEGGAKIAEQAFEDFTKEKIHAGVDALRDTTTASYESIRRSQIAGTPPDPRAVQTAGFTGSLASKTGLSPDVPEQLQAGLDKATDLALAKSQGKANDTLYTGALNALSKQLRAQYPGHRDFIDEQISRISGVNPANAYMQNLLVDINRASTGEDAFRKKIFTMATDSRNAGNPDVQTALIAAQRGLPNSWENLTSAVLRSENNHWKYEQWQQRQAVNKGNLEADADNAKFEMETRSQDILGNHVNPIFANTGLTDVKTLNDLVQKGLNGETTLSPTQWEGVANSLHAAWLNTTQDMRNTFDREGYSARIKNPQYVTDLITNKAKYIKDMEDAVRSGDYGTLFELKRRNEEQLEESRGKAFASPIGEWMRQRQVLAQALGPNWMNVADSLSITRGTALKDLQSFYNEATVNSMAAPDMRSAQNVQSLYDSLQAAKTARNQGANAPAKTYDNLVENVDILQRTRGKTDPQSREIAKNVIDYMFDPQKNSKIMDFFGRDFTDDKGVFHRGRFAFYDIMTSPKNVDAIHELKDPASWQKFKDWEEFSFKRLYQEEVKNLNTIQGDASIPFKLDWDSENHRFGLKFETNRPSTQTDVNYMQWAQRSVNALNGSLNNLSYMHSKMGGDTNEYLWDMMMGLGYQPSTKVNGTFPEKALAAIKASHTPPPSAGEAYKRAQ